MNALSYTLYLALFLSFSLGLYFVSNVLDLLKMTASHKLLVLKAGLLLLALSPFIFLLLSATATKTIEIKMPNLYIDPSAAIPALLPPMQQKVYWPLFLSIGYAVGISIVVTNLVRNYFITQKWLSNSTAVELLGQAVLLSPNITSPLSFGFFQPQIYFPQNVQRSWKSREIQLGLNHEQNHIVRRDPLWKLISLFVRSLLFFAPWMYVIHRKLELEMEILCDETTCLVTQSSTEEYGSLLLSLVCKNEDKNLLLTNITDSTIKRRIVSMKSRKIQRPIFAAFLSSTLLLGGVAAIAATSGVAEKKSVFKISSAIFINGKEVSSPRVIVTANEKAQISQKSDTNGDELQMELVANDVNMPNLKNGIGLNFDIHYRMGEIKGHAAPQVILAPNEEGTIKIGGDDGQLFEMRIKAERE
jgi:beta-lactamase regulating signal transducer with metallopeptidase domain